MTTQQKKKKIPEGGAERRQAVRRPVIDSFSLFLTVPGKGPHRLPVHDVSELGLGFDVDVDGEPESSFLVEKGAVIDLQFHLNSSLALPLRVKVARIEGAGGVRTVGTYFSQEPDENGEGYLAFRSFVAMIDEIAEIKGKAPKR